MRCLFGCPDFSFIDKKSQILPQESLLKVKIKEFRLNYTHRYMYVSFGTGSTVVKRMHRVHVHVLPMCSRITYQLMNRINETSWFLYFFTNNIHVTTLSHVWYKFSFQRVQNICEQTRSSVWCIEHYNILYYMYMYTYSYDTSGRFLSIMPCEKQAMKVVMHKRSDYF